MAKGKILIVDDEKIVREAFMVAFGDEFEISNAASAKEALSILKRYRDINQVVVDVMMPDSNGIELVSKIKALNPNLGIILLTGFASKSIIDEALSSGVDEVVEKPFDLKEMREVIRKLLKLKR